MVQLSHVYMTSGKAIALTTQTLAGKVMSFSKILFIYFWLPRVFLAVCGLSLVVVCGLLIVVASVVAEHRPQGA